MQGDDIGGRQFGTRSSQDQRLGQEEQKKEVRYPEDTRLRPFELSSGQDHYFDEIRPVAADPGSSPLSTGKAVFFSFEVYIEAPRKRRCALQFLGMHRAA